MENYIIREFVDIIGGEPDSSSKISSGTVLEVTTPPGCWGAMITPSIRSGHEVSKPVYLEDAEPGDSVALEILSVEVNSKYASSGTGRKIEGRYKNDPTINAVCPGCGIENPETVLNGYGENSIVCKNCGASALPQTMSNGYTVILDSKSGISLSCDEKSAEIISEKVSNNEECPPLGSRQHLATILGKHDVVGVISRIVPMVGNIGCSPEVSVPSSRNGGDMLRSLNKNKEFEHVTKENLTDGHLDINSVREGSTVIAPVKVKGAGIYLGDVHSIQGAGELAGHTIDVTATVKVRVSLLKKLTVPSPIIIPNLEDVNFRFRPFNEEEIKNVNKIAEGWNMDKPQNQYPVQFTGSGDGMNEAIENAVKNASVFLNIPEEEVKNRATISGEVGIGRTSGFAYLTIALPEGITDGTGLGAYIQK